MQIFIDVAPADAEPVFGLDPVARHLRAITKLTPKPRVHISQRGHDSAHSSPASVHEEAVLSSRLARHLEARGCPAVVVDGAAFVDRRLLELLVQGAEPVCLRGGEGTERAAVLRLTPAVLPLPNAETVLELADALVTENKVREASFDEFPMFVVKLRREVPFTLQSVPDTASRSRLERRLFWLNYKGSTDFLTKWVYPPLVWPLVRFCTSRRIHPNWLTVISVILAIAAIPLFAQGMWIAALAAAYVMSVLDSVDGKVARVTLTDSRAGDLLDHGLDAVHPPFWYAAWAYGLGMSGPGDPLFTATALLVLFYLADRLTLKLAKRRFGRGLHAVTRLDGLVRTWIARRNTNLAVFTVGLALGVGYEAFFFIVFWQGLTVLWHASRTLWLSRPASGLSAQLQRRKA